MVQTRIEQFFSMAFKDPQLVAKMQQGAGGPENFIGNAVKVAKEHDYEFSAPEAAAWIEQQQRALAGGELSNAQLEGVAGGLSSLNQALVTQDTQQLTQESVALISSISKSMYDTSQSIISNIKA